MIMKEKRSLRRPSLLTLLVYLWLHLISEKDNLLSSHSGCTKGRKEEGKFNCALEVPSLGTPYLLFFFPKALGFANLLFHWADS